MTSQFEYMAVEGDAITDYMFGGNLLANRGTLYGEGQYDTAINDLGVTTLRYPGGSRTEKSFEITDPDADQVLDKETGRIDDWIALTDFFAYAETNGHPVSIVLPTRFNLSDEFDDYGNRSPDFNEEELRTFIRDVATGTYGNPEILAFEIGNEYWHSGQMNSLEYGRLAAAMTEIIHDELSKAALTHPQNGDIQITVQMGLNYGTGRLTEQFEGLDPDTALSIANLEFGLNLSTDALYSGGAVNWNYVANRIIINEFEQNDLMHMVDGVIAHVYSLGEQNEWSRIFELKQVEDTWMRDYPDLDIHVTEWNQKGVTDALERHEDYGLHQAEEMLNLVEEFARAGVDYANVWPLIQWTDNALNFGWEYDVPNAPGTMFRLMAENLPGMTLIDLAPGDEYVTEAEFDHISVHAFASQTEIVLYLTPSGDQIVAGTDLDLSGLFVGFDSLELTLLGTDERWQGLGSNGTHATLDDIDPSTAIRNGILDVALDRHEILQVVVGGYLPADGFADLFFSDDAGSTSARTVFGSAGDDVLLGDVLSNSLFGGEGNDNLFGDSGDDNLFGDSGEDLLDGGDGQDSLMGEQGEDVIWGRKGDDHIFGGSNNDTLMGNDGDDCIDGGFGHDNITGGLGSDAITGGHHGDSIRGGSGEDVIYGGHGLDKIRGNDGSDTISGDSGDDRIWAGAGRDLVYGGIGDDIISGNVGGDILYGGDGNDSLAGNNGADLIVGGLGDDQIAGGNGADRISGENGIDLLFGGNGRDLIFGGEGNDILDGGDGYDELDGGAGDDEINGGDHSDSIIAGSGNDTIYGGHGDDQIRGNDGADYIVGGEGNDLIWAGSGDDRVFGGNENDTIAGNIGDDIIFGGNGSDVLFGNSGSDTLGGGSGDDILTGGIGSDVFEFTSGADVISDYEMRVDRLLIDDALLGDNLLSWEVFQSLSSPHDGNGIRLDFGGGHSLMLEGDINLTDLFNDLI